MLWKSGKSGRKQPEASSGLRVSPWQPSSPPRGLRQRRAAKDPKRHALQTCDRSDQAQARSSSMCGVAHATRSKHARRPKPS